MPGRVKVTFHTYRKFGAAEATTNRQGVRSILHKRRRVDYRRNERAAAIAG